jgi:hypothetical protein
MPLIYWGTGWFIGIALASTLRLLIEFLPPAFLAPIVGLVLWGNDHRARLIWFSVMPAILGGMWFTLRLPRFDQNSLSTHNGIGVVTIEGVIDADPDVRDTYLNLRVNADRLTTSDRRYRPCSAFTSRRISLRRSGARDGTTNCLRPWNSPRSTTPTTSRGRACIR